MASLTIQVIQAWPCFVAVYETGLSGTSRLHDLFINIEGMTPGEYKNGGKVFQLIIVFPKASSGISLWHQPAKEFLTRPLRKMKIEYSLI